MTAHKNSNDNARLKQLLLQLRSVAKELREEMKLLPDAAKKEASDEAYIIVSSVCADCPPPDLGEPPE